MSYTLAMFDSAHLMSWQRPEWRVEAGVWIDSGLKRLGQVRTGPIEDFHVRAWSTVLRVPTDSGPLFFKAPSPLFSAEVKLLPRLANWQPEIILPVLEVDYVRNWLLLPNGGLPLRDLKGTRTGLVVWEKLLPIYAQLQIDLAGRTEELLELGIFDRRLATLPGKVAAVLGDHQVIFPDRLDGLTRGEHRRLLAYLPTFSRLCQELDSIGIPETLQHDDLHGNNILVDSNGPPPRGPYIVDWGDCCISHPFFTMTSTLKSVAFHYGLAPDSQEIVRLRNLYLEPWTALLSWKRLETTFELALRLGRLSRMLTWYLLVKNLVSLECDQFQSGLIGWLREYLEGEEEAGAA